MWKFNVEIIDEVAGMCGVPVRNENGVSLVL